MVRRIASSDNQDLCSIFQSSYGEEYPHERRGSILRGNEVRRVLTIQTRVSEVNKPLPNKYQEEKKSPLLDGTEEGRTTALKDVLLQHNPKPHKDLEGVGLVS